MSAGTIIRKYGRLAFAVIAIIIGSAVVYQSGNRLFEIRKIEVEGTGFNVTVDQSRVPKNLLFFPSDKLRAQILNDNPFLEDLRFKKKIPHTLVVVVVAREPIAKLTSDSVSVTLDKSGVILPDTGNRGVLPRFLFSLANTKIGDRTGDLRILTGLKFVEETAGFLSVITVSPFEETSLLARTSKTDIFIPQDGDVKNLARSLQTLLTGFRIKGNLPAKIDLRFDKPIVTY